MNERPQWLRLMHRSRMQIVELFHKQTLRPIATKCQIASASSPNIAIIWSRAAPYLGGSWAECEGDCMQKLNTCRSDSVCERRLGALGGRSRGTCACGTV